MFKRVFNRFTGGEEDETDEEEPNPSGESLAYEPIQPPESMVTAVSPSSVKIKSETARSGTKWAKTLFIADWPDTADPGILSTVTTHPSAEVSVSIHTNPRDQQRAIKQFESAIRDLEQQRLTEEQSGNPSMATQRRIGDHKDILSQLEDGAQKVFDVSVYITVRSATEERTEKVARKIINELRREQLSAVSVDYRQDDGLTSASPVAKNVLAADLPTVQTPMLGQGVGSLLPFSATTIVEESGIFYGQHTTTEEPVLVDRYNRPNGYNVFTAGEIGAGKSYGTKLLNLRMLAKDKDTILVMLDPLSGFRDLADGLDAENVVVDGTRGINPLDIQPTPDHVLEENPQLNPFRDSFQSSMGFFETFFETVGGAKLDKTERSVLAEALRTAYAEKGITTDPDTHGNESPTVLDVMRVLAEIEDDPEAYIQGMDEDEDLLEIDAPKPSQRTMETWQTAASDLRIAMHPFQTAEYAHLAGETDIELQEANATYLDLQQGEGDRELGMMMMLLLDTVYQRVKNSDKRVVLCIDEAHYLMQNDHALDWMERLTRHSRHHDLSLHLVTQEASDFLINEKAVTIANNCSQKILHRLPGLTNEDAAALGLTETEADFVRNAKPGTPERGYSQALLDVEDGPTLPIKIWAYSKEEAIIEGETSSTSDEPAEECDGGMVARTDGGEE